MKRPLLSKLLLRYAAALSLITIIIYGCKKEFNATQPSATLSANVSAAQNWYQTTYPVIPHSGKKIQSTPSGIPDYSQFLQPDWDNAVTYSRFGQDVTEVPVGANSPFSASLKNTTLNQTVYRKQDSKSSFLILKDSTGYHAFVMVLMADSAWLNGDQGKLAAQHYNKRSPDFTGLVMYFTPKGQAAGMWQYSGGQIVSNNSIKSNKQIQNSGKKVNEADGNEVCYNYYLVFYVNGVEDDNAFEPVLLWSTCPPDGGAGNSAPSGGTPVAVPVFVGSGSGNGSAANDNYNPCNPVSESPDVQSLKKTNAIKIAQASSDQAPPDDNGGYPQPNGDSTYDPCTDYSDPIQQAYPDQGFRPLCMSSLIFSRLTSNTVQVNLQGAQFGILDASSNEAKVIVFNLQVTIPNQIQNPSNPSQAYNFTTAQLQSFVYEAYHYASEYVDLAHGQDFFSAGSQPKYSQQFASAMQGYLNSIALQGMFPSYENSNGVPSIGSRVSTQINPSKASPAQYTNGGSGRGC